MDATLPDRKKFLTTFLQNAAFEGWTAHCMRHTANVLGCSPEISEILFPGGPAEVATFFSVHIDLAMEREAIRQNLTEQKIRDRIASLVMLRLELYAKEVDSHFPESCNREAIKHLVGFLSLPQHITLGTTLVWQTVDQIWYLAGDTSTDHNHYSKRTLLAGVYSSTLLYWLSDESPDFTETRAFLARRIQNIMQLQNLKGKLKECWQKVPFFGAPYTPTRARP